MPPKTFTCSQCGESISSIMDEYNQLDIKYEETHKALGELM